VSFAPLTCRYALRTCSNAPQTPNSGQKACFPPSALKDIYKKRPLDLFAQHTVRPANYPTPRFLSPTCQSTPNQASNRIPTRCQGSLSGTPAVMVATPINTSVFKRHHYTSTSSLKCRSVRCQLLHAVIGCCFTCVRVRVCVQLDLPR
jgi:hypothetical protein